MALVLSRCVSPSVRNLNSASGRIVNLVVDQVYGRVDSSLMESLHDENVGLHSATLSLSSLRGQTMFHILEFKSSQSIRSFHSVFWQELATAARVWFSLHSEEVCRPGLTALPLYG